MLCLFFYLTEYGVWCQTDIRSSVTTDGLTLFDRYKIVPLFVLVSFNYLQEWALFYYIYESKWRLLFLVNSFWLLVAPPLSEFTQLNWLNVFVSLFTVLRLFPRRFSFTVWLRLVSVTAWLFAASWLYSSGDRNDPLSIPARYLISHQTLTTWRLIALRNTSSPSWKRRVVHLTPYHGQEPTELLQWRLEPRWLYIKLIHLLLMSRLRSK